MELELRHLRLVLAVADAGSVTKAAAGLGLNQPALTMQLKRIERILGGALFVRGRQGVEPTPLGDLVLTRARVLIPAVTDLHSEISELVMDGGPSRYRVGVTNGPIVGGLLQRLTTAYPDAQVAMHSSWSANELAQQVLAGDLEYALVGACAEATPAAGLPLVWRAVSVDPVWVLLNERHPLAGRDEVDLAELSAERWVTAPGDGCFQECFADACARAGFAPRAPHEIDVGAAFDLVAAGQAVALCQGTVRSLPGVTAVPLAGAPLRWRHLLGWDPVGAAARYAPAVVEMASGAYGEIVSQRPRYQSWLAGNPGFGAA
ncbi:MAG: LysR family transcriptional regulator [Actinoplanes sp.]